MNRFDRRGFLKGLGGSVVASAGAWEALHSIVPASAAESQVTPDVVQFRPEMEPVVRWIESTPRERVFDVAVEQLKRGLSYRQLLAGLFLAGIRNVKPRPVGFKFHAVMVINSAHELALDAPQADRLLPFFWALDTFKSAQQQDEKEGDWWLAPANERAVPSPGVARRRFIEAMDGWDAEAADAAVAGLYRAAGASEVIELLWPYGARDWENIGHNIIFTAHAWRTLQTIGWEHAEPVLRSLVFGLLSGKPGDTTAPYDSNRELVAKVRSDWPAGQPDAAASDMLLHTLRQATPDEAAKQVVDLLNRGVAASSLWDGVTRAAGELLMRQPGIVALHATTASNSLHYAFRASGADATRLLMLLQAAAWIALYREGVRTRNGLPDHPLIDELQPVEPGQLPGIEVVFQDLTKNRLQAARQVLAMAGSDESARSFMDAARHLVFTKGTDAHDYKFAAAAFEEFLHANPSSRPQLLAASVFHLRGASERESPLLEGTREALKALGT